MPFTLQAEALQAALMECQQRGRLPWIIQKWYTMLEARFLATAHRQSYVSWADGVAMITVASMWHQLGGRGRIAPYRAHVILRQMREYQTQG